MALRAHSARFDFEALSQHLIKLLLGPVVSEVPGLPFRAASLGVAEPGEESRDMLGALGWDGMKWDGDGDQMGWDGDGNGMEMGIEWDGMGTGMGTGRVRAFCPTAPCRLHTEVTLNAKAGTAGTEFFHLYSQLSGGD